MKTVMLLLAGCAIVAVSGCGECDCSVYHETIDELKIENKELGRRFADCSEQNQAYAKRVAVLSGIDPNIYEMTKPGAKDVRIGSYTGIYDRDRNGSRRLVVYIEPVDHQGDIVKLPGEVKVQLWDLARPPQESLLGSWKIEYDQLKKLWYSSLGKSNYRLTFEVGDRLNDLKNPLTVKVNYVDLLSGQAFDLQHVVRN